MEETELLTVGAVIKRTGLSRKALRLYEQARLVEPVTRTAAGYRLYAAEALPRLDLIRRARALDVGIRDLGELLAIAEGSSEQAHGELSAFVAEKLRDTDRRIAELQALQRLLRTVQQRVAQGTAADLTPGHRCGSPLCTCPIGDGGGSSSHVDQF